MPVQATIAITPGTGQLLDAVSLVIGSQTVVRETMVLADPTNPTSLAAVSAAGALNVSDAIIGACITANVLAVSLPAGQITSLTPPTAAAIAAAIVANPPTVTSTISGTVGVTQSTSPWVVSLASTTITGSVAVTGTFFQATQPVSGTITANQGGAPWSVTFPSAQAVTLASTTITGTVATTQSTSPWVVSNSGIFAVQAALAAETTKVIGVVRNADGAGNLLTSTSNALDINIKSGSIANTSFAATQPTAASLNATVVGTGTFAVQASITTLGQSLAAASVPVVLTAAQLITLTPPTTVAVTQSTTPWIVAGGGTAGASGTAVLTVQGISGGTTLPVTATIAAAQTIAVTNTGTFAVQSTNNITQWGGTNVSAPPAASTPPAGTEVAPVIRPILRKSTQILSTTPLAGNATFTSSWFDSNADGTVVVQVYAFSNLVSSASGFTIQETDDTTNASMLRTLTSATTQASILAQIIATVRARFWRAVFTNGSASTQGSFELTATASNQPLPILEGVIPNANIQFPTKLMMAAAANVGLGVPALLAATSGGEGVSPGSLADGQGGTTHSLMVTNFVSAGASTVAANNVALRTPAVFKTVQATASGNTALWTPTSGKKFRLMRFIVDVTDNAATASGAVITVSFQDAAAAIGIAFDVFVPAAGVTTVLGGYSSGWIDLGNGFLSALANNVLNVNLSAALTAATGVVRVTCCGTEE